LGRPLPLKQSAALFLLKKYVFLMDQQAASPHGTGDYRYLYLLRFSAKAQLRSERTDGSAVSNAG
jgi:hypothetical protein